MSEGRSPEVSRSRAEQVLTDSLRLQRSAARAQQSRRRGRRRKGDIIDLDRKTITKRRRHRAFLALLFAEAVVAALAVAVFVYFVLSGRSTS